MLLLCYIYRMTVYIEVVILDNFVITCLISALSYRVNCVRVSVLRTIIVAAIGTVVAVMYPFITLPPLLSTICKILLGILLSTILFFKKANLIKGIFTFLLCTFLFGGLLFALSLMRFGNVQKALTTPFISLPIGLVLLAALLLYYLLKSFFIFLHQRHRGKNFLYDVKIEILGKSIISKAFLDSGNHLTDAKSGLPVVVMNVKEILPYLNDAQLSNLMTGGAQKVFQRSYYTTMTTANGSSKILLVQPERFYVYLTKDKNILYEVMIGLSFHKIEMGGVGILLPPILP